MKTEKISPQQRYDCFRTAVRGTFPCHRITATETWLATISHELNNPLTAILNATTVLGRSSNDPAVVEKLSTSIMQSAQMMQVVIRDLLDLSRMDAGMFTIEKTWIHARALQSSIAQSLVPTAAKKGLELRIDLRGELFCDLARVTQVLANLVGNSLKFTEQGCVIVTGEHMRDRYRILVEDTGIGIDPKSLPHVFDRFWQAQTSQKANGTGLGLAIVRGIVEAHGGEFKIESIRGKGTCVSFELPDPEGPAQATRSA